MRPKLLVLLRDWLLKIWRRSPLPLKMIAVLGAIALVVRLTPFLMPLQAADIAQTDQAFRFYDRNGLFLGTVLSADQENTSVVSLDEVSPYFQQAIIAAEDGDFYHHGPLDLQAIARATYQAIKHQKIVSGASTITMQLARMLGDRPRTLHAKLQEIWVAWRLGAGMNRQEILTAYINRLPMGGNIYGVEAAAQIYFGVAAADLNLAQATLLAAIPNSPTYLNPYHYWDNLKQRQRYVLERLVAEGELSPEQADRVFQEAVTLQPRHQGILSAPHFVFLLTDQLDTSQNPVIRTTLDKNLQDFVAAQVRQSVLNLNQNHVHQGAAIAIDNQTGEILAYVGSTDYFTPQGETDGIQSLRQPGSTLKPFLYQLALENRIIRPNTILADIPTYYAIPDAKLYEPTDYDEKFLGPVRVRLALGNSLNIPAVRVLEKVGVEAFLQRLHQLGFQHLTEAPDYYGLGLTLGSGEVTLMELANAYRTLANGGKKSDLVSHFAHPESATTFLSDSSTWQLITQMLSDKQARAIAFGVDSALNLPFPAAVKTGTSSNYRDTWAVGFSEKYTVATWIGNFDGTPMQQVSGVAGAAPLWREIMLHLHQQREPSAFSEPAAMVKRPICALSGKKSTGLCPVIVQEYFFPEDLAEYEMDLDDFYQEINGEIRLVLPPEYDRWLATQTTLAMPQSGLKILFPQDGDRLLSDPNNPGQLVVQFQTTNQEPVQWRLNGNPWQPDDPQNPKLRLTPGPQTLEIRQGDRQDQVNFSVEVAPSQTTKRGFSVN
ncbi:penicillin-binding protein 1C [Picosynechococcus sp. PCC 7117]|uniref:penicillin-binding protein 1C n=1 Tax=Picosynechococcus sp. PCC 7117 TaxID=195498 RepID=UPI000A05DF60|nr:penicillin-binding protein 1C [Picosynechococcus sp. PCC 7117]